MLTFLLIFFYLKNLSSLRIVLVQERLRNNPGKWAITEMLPNYQNILGLFSSTSLWRRNPSFPGFHPWRRLWVPSCTCVLWQTSSTPWCVVCWITLIYMVAGIKKGEKKLYFVPFHHVALGSWFCWGISLLCIFASGIGVLVHAVAAVGCQAGPVWNGVFHR